MSWWMIGSSGWSSSSGSNSSTGSSSGSSCRPGHRHRAVAGSRYLYKVGASAMLMSQPPPIHLVLSLTLLPPTAAATAAAAAAAAAAAMQAMLLNRTNVQISTTCLMAYSVARQQQAWLRQQL
ncbi:hypothetical protein OEZ85_012698 [Tetradesmus obliquus]|uniref:Uncharacterized protein n=1 Tax=Tetradesmus obliquus TaxID=3088 RepID=A0ABY8U3Z3_TETOB|nr:hypothetical protein OEZ85_012698 [Tetradesmus obliquus]